MTPVQSVKEGRATANQRARGYSSTDNDSRKTRPSSCVLTAKSPMEMRVVFKYKWVRGTGVSAILEHLQTMYTGVQKLRTRRFFQYNFVQKLSKSTHLIR
ncbi:hypothetical protein TNCV_4529601 [Trichonephila clavipes]|nr:hypothetical protein TNCV_4529601 [Trichonephila clavipes]